MHELLALDVVSSTFHACVEHDTDTQYCYGAISGTSPYPMTHRCDLFTREISIVWLLLHRFPGLYSLSGSASLLHLHSRECSVRPLEACCRPHTPSTLPMAGTESPPETTGISTSAGAPVGPVQLAQTSPPPPKASDSVVHHHHPSAPVRPLPCANASIDRPVQTGEEQSGSRGRMGSRERKNRARDGQR
jgi:hypothetical protein